MQDSVRANRLERVLDFGLSPTEVEERAKLTPHTTDEIAALIVDEDELRRLGRWGGMVQPRRRLRGN